jgi:hypothetical protein
MASVNFYGLPGGWALAWKWSTSDGWSINGKKHHFHVGKERDKNLVLYRIVVLDLIVWIGRDLEWGRKHG